MITPARGTIGRVALALIAVIVVALVVDALLLSTGLGAGSLATTQTVLYDCVLGGRRCSARSGRSPFPGSGRRGR